MRPGSIIANYQWGSPENAKRFEELGRARGVTVIDAPTSNGDPTTGRVKRTIPVRVGLVTLAWSPDGRWLATAGHDRVIRIHDAATGRQK